MLTEGLTVGGSTKPTPRSPTKAYPWVRLQSDIHRLGVRSRTEVRPTGRAAGAERVGMLKEGVTVSGVTKPTSRSPTRLTRGSDFSPTSTGWECAVGLKSDPQGTRPGRSGLAC